MGDNNNKKTKTVVISGFPQNNNVPIIEKWRRPRTKAVWYASGFLLFMLLFTLSLLEFESCRKTCNYNNNISSSETLQTCKENNCMASVVCAIVCGFGTMIALGLLVLYITQCIQIENKEY